MTNDRAEKRGAKLPDDSADPEPEGAALLIHPDGLATPWIRPGVDHDPAAPRTPGDQRGVELLVEAGFTPVEAVHIATQNGAELLGEGARLGTLAPGSLADLVVLRGDPSTRIEDIEKVEWVFKDGIGYDPAKLIDSVRGQVGQ